jgi:lipopolysaccharide/colanic/teichoic acid biosynthesis glycosyltransferase
MMQYLKMYSPEQARRHDVRPGVTGLAQVSGRNALGWEEKFRLDVEYVDHHSFVGDLKILCGTVRSVLRREGSTYLAGWGSPEEEVLRRENENNEERT